ncbi:cellulase family glycosylhydrolase [Mycolicibacterium frederiksbergense]|uniref:cellulase family glycosylhydrolase n=1 Tax=Mycolicibacterium frederiksbergense TaxID=117567 RepID=UPI001438FAA2|nr:cellulase family glycosylhydrolase [Mycolicibacterium frederiksbergense]
MWKCVPPSVRGIANRVVIGVTTAALVAATGSHFVMPEAKQLVSYEVMNVAAIDESPTTVGIADSNIYFTDSLDEVMEHLDLIESLGVKNVRLLVPWIFIQQQDPMGGPVDWDQDLDWAKLDQIVQEVDRRGLGILGVLQWSPDWATEGTVGSGHPTDVQDFADFAAAVAERYRDEITAYEVWNEPNASFFWNPIDPAEYTNLLKAAYTSLKAVNPDITVVGAVVSATLTWGDTTMNPVDFVAAMYEAGADGFFDAISFHPYNFDTKFSEQDDLDWRELMPLFQVQKIRELMDQHLAPGEEQLKIWISEYGLPTSVVTPEKQLAFMTDLLNAWQSFSGGGPVFLYTTKDDMSAIGDERFFGLFDENGNFKGGEAAYQEFKRLIDCLGGCSPSNPSNPVGSLLQFLQQVITQVLSFVPNLVAGVVSAVSNLISSILNGLSGLAGGSAAPAGVVGASLRSAMATTDADVTPAAPVTGDLESIEAGTEAPGAETAAQEVAVAEDLVAVEDAVTEEVVAEVPVVEDVVTEEVVAEVPVVEDAVAEEVVAEVPVVEDVVTEEVVTEVPVVEDVVTEEVVAEVPVVEDVVTEEVVAETPGTEEIVSEAPAVTDPTTTDDGTDTSVDEAGVAEGSAPELSDKSVSKLTDTEEPAAETKVTRSAPKAGVGSTAPRQRSVRSVRSSA